MEQYVPIKFFVNVNAIINNDVFMKFYKKNYYMWKQCIGCGLGAGFFQTMHSLKFQQDEGPDKTVLHPITFANKSISSTKIQQYRMRSSRHMSWTSEV